MRFLSKVIIKLYLNVFFLWLICPKYLFFSYSHAFCPRRKTNLNFYSVQSHPKASEKEKFHGNWNSHDIWRVSTQTKTICRVSRSLCSKRWGHILKKSFFLNVQSNPPKKFPNSPIFNDFTACHVCVAVHPDLKSCARRAKCFFPKAPWQ